MGCLTSDNRSVIWHFLYSERLGLKALDERISKQDLETSIYW